MFFGILLGTLVVASRFRWPVAWIGIELNLIAFIPYSIFSFNSKKRAMTYFVSQSCGSLLVLVGGILSDHSLLSLSLLIRGLILKIGLIPLHFWVPLVIVNLSQFQLYLLISWQKIAPLLLLLRSSFGLTILRGFNACLGAITIRSLSLLRIILIFRGIVQIGWVLVLTGSFSVYYLGVYFVVLGAVVYFSAKATVQFGWALVNAGGLPPFSGFIIKLKAILNIKNSFALLLVSASGLALCSYVRLIMNARLKAEPVSGVLMVACGVGIV